MAKTATTARRSKKAAPAQADLQGLLRTALANIELAKADVRSAFAYVERAENLLTQVLAQMPIEAAAPAAAPASLNA